VLAIQSYTATAKKTAAPYVFLECRDLLRRRKDIDGEVRMPAPGSSTHCIMTGIKFCRSQAILPPKELRITRVQLARAPEPRVVLWTVSWMVGGWSVGMACESAGAQYTGSICARIGDARRPCDPLTTTLTFSAPSVTDLSHSRTRRVSKRVFRTIESVNCTLRCVEDAHMRDGLEWQLCRYGMFAILIGRPNHPTRRGRRRGQSGWHSE
jgi:hypothetical protein